jgi:phospholipid transport system substrate-binding protein
VAEKFIDKKRFAQITLGRDWRKLDPAQQEEFTQLYADLVEKTYIDRIREYTDEKVLITGETRPDGNKAEVSTIVVSKGKEIPVVYRMYNDGGRWRTYDVLVEGVSFVMNYRSQFNDILAKGSPESLLRQLRQKVSS